MSNDTIILEMKKVIEEYLTKNPHLSIQSIADKSKVGYNTIRRIINRQGVPELGQVVKILGAISREDKMAEILERYGPNIRETLHKAFANLCQESNPKFSIDDISRDPDNFLIMTLAVNPQGTTLGELELVIGKRAKKKVDKLIEQDILLIEENNVIKARVKYLSFSLEVLKQQLSTMFKYYDVEHAGQKRNYIHALSNSVNREGLKKMQSLHKEFHQKILKVVQEEENQGTIPAFSVAFMDTFVSDIES